MPIYEYLCESCQNQVEIMQKSTDPAPNKCEACGHGPMVKQLSMTSFALKGTGWYVTDFKGRSSKSSGSTANNEPASSEAPSAAPSPAPTKESSTS